MDMPPPASQAHAPAQAETEAEAQAPAQARGPSGPSGGLGHLSGPSGPSGPSSSRQQAPVVLLTDRLEKPSLDDRDYRVIRLDNELEALLVHDPETDKASAALDVNVGNFSDEDGMPGMAHAVEHLLFMGTKKFPIENEYGQYLSANSGSSNAYTAATSTNYYFDVAAKPANDGDPSDANPSPLREALDRFAQFFIEPLFLSSTLDRELKAVDSENKKNLQNDTWRLHQLDKSLSNPNHPYCHFSTGNLEVLKTLPEASGVNVRDKFIEFHDKHYSANRMKLVILGREPLDVLQKWAVELFSGIVNKNLPPNRWPDEVPFRESEIGLQWFAKPVMDSRELNLYFPFIDEENLFESQPSRYISHLIGHEGPGSIMSYIKNKGWANSLSAGAYPVCPGTPGIFEVQIRLTEAGLKVYPEIVKIFFQYISLLREAPPQEWIFQEQKGMADVDFKFRQKTPASRFTSRVSSVMQKPLPREWLLSGQSRLRTFDPKCIKHALATIRPDNLRLAIISRTFPGSWDKKEKWYGTEYRHEKIPHDVMEEWKRAVETRRENRLPELHLPHKNNFIPNKLEVEKKEVAEPALAPRILRNDAEARTWWKKDDTFWVPKANVIVSLKNPIIYTSAENSVKARLFTELVRDALEEYSYDAELAGLQYSVSLDSRGLFLDISGYNDKLPVLLEQVAVTLRDIEIKDERFIIVKERLTRGYENWQLQSSYQQVGDYMSWLNAERDYVVEELAVELRGITVDDVRQFHKQMLGQLYIEVYVHGNMYKGEALRATDMVESTLKPRVLPKDQWPLIRSLVLPPGSNYVYNKTLKDPENVNHCVETWFYIGDKGDRDVRAKTLLIDQMIHEPAFDQLRTKEQLGYIVFASIRSFATTCGFRFLIQSERTPNYLDRRIEAFLVQFGETLQKMTETEFEGHKRSLIIKRLEKLRNLDQETARHWAQISNEYYDFEQVQLDAARVKLLTKAEMVSFYNKYLSPSSETRARISVHLHARGAGEVNSEVTNRVQTLGLNGVPPDDERSSTIVKLHGLAQTTQAGPASDGVSAVDSAVEITDGQKHRAGLEVSLGARPVKDLSEYEELDSKLCPLELPAQLTVKTSSSKKRKLARPLALDLDSPHSPSPDTVLPSCEPDDDVALSFSATPIAFGLEAPPYVRADSGPASSIPSRLQTQGGSLVSADYASSAASSPSTSVCPDPSLDSDRGGDDAASVRTYELARSQSPFLISKRAIMNGDAELPQRSSSPLKRRASSMDPETVVGNNGDVGDAGDVEMGTSDSPPGPSGLPRAMSVDVPDPKEESGADTNSTERLPPLMEQVKIIEMLLKAFGEAPPKEGEKAYLVSRTWVDKALQLRSDSKQSKAEPVDRSLGPVDNSDIIEDVIKEPGRESFTRLKPGTDLQSFELLPEDAWKLVMEWYGIKEGQDPIVRTAINIAPDAQSEPNILYELHLPVFRVHRLWSELSPLPIEQSLKANDPPPLLIARSRKYHAQTFIKDLKKLTGIPIERKIRMWTVPQQLPAASTSEPRSALTPPDSPTRARDPNNPQNSWPTLLLDVVSFSSVRDSKIEVPLKDFTGNANYNGSAPLQMFQLVTDQTLVLDESIDQGNWVSICTSRSRAEKSIPTRINATTSPSKPNSDRSSSSPEGPVTRGRVQKKGHGRSFGAVGLHNLGNTCYMNSALQCVRSVEELTKYFLTEASSAEVNKTNPLGYNGKVAMAYGSLLKEIYEDGRGSVSPRDFKNMVGRCRSTFAGWGQQDSQEFLGFLLDALQEDLSRIKKKPYIEKPDSTDDMVNNPEAIREMADKVWDITRKRDDSVIADLFTGMYKSTLKCPECGKISITFDPFNNLTLPLPLQNMWRNTIKFFPLNDVPVNIEAELLKHSSVEALKQFLSIQTGVPVNRLMGAEEFKDRIFKLYDNSQDVFEEIQSTDCPTFHELEAVPTNWPGMGPKKPRSMLDIEPAAEWDDVRYETMVVPVLHRRPQAPGRGLEGACPPHFITLTRDEASNHDMIRRKVLEKVATFSTWSKFTQEQGAEGSDTLDADMVIATASDADSSGDSKVVAQSVEGEDDMVDVTMNDANNSTAVQLPPLPHQPKILRHFNTRRPRFIQQPGEFLDPELQNLFELSYFTNSSEGAVPTGWLNVENNTKIFPKLSDRIPDSSTKEEDEPGPEGWNSTASGNEDSSNDEGSRPESVQTRMIDESSEEDVPHGARTLTRPGNRPNQKPGAGGRKKFKGHKTYGKKGNKRRDKQMRAGKQGHRMPAVDPQPMPAAVADGGPLIRLHEGLVVDWNEEAWEVVFGQTARNNNPAKGARTFIEPETLHDPALKISQRRQESRISRGITLEECLDEFERAEVLSEQDMWYCPRCKEHRRASKKFDLWKSPDILVAHLKRFSSSGWRRDKLDVVVDFPIEGLDLTSRVIQKEDGKDEIYDLIAVDDHYGGLGGGHYTAYAKNFVDGRWYNYNDSSVSPVSDLSSVVTSAAYLLFYRRRTRGHLGGPRFAQIFEKYNKDMGNGEDETSESGNGDGLGGGSSLQAAASRAAIKPLVNSRDGPAPPYEETTQSETIHHSIEDEGLELSSNDQVMRPKSLDMTQSWSFSALDGSGAEGSTGADYASDDAQFDSSGDERGSGDFFEADTHMTPAGAANACVDGEAQSPPGSNGGEWPKGGVVSVPPAVGGEDSDEVAEIHIDADHTSRW